MDGLYVLEPGSLIRKDGTTLKIVKGDAVLAQIPAEGLQRLTLVGYASLTGAVLDFLIRNRIETVFMTPTGRFRARLMVNEHHHVARRQAQYARLSDPGFSLNTARCFVRGKLENQLQFLLRRARDYGVTELRETAVRIRALQKQLEEAPDADTVRGIEGYGTRLYFAAFPMLIRSTEFTFQGRNKRPPRDPVNAMLSLVYTLFTNEVLSAVNAAGLDPYLGSLHEVAHGRPSLVCDLVEEWRTVGDRMVLTLINLKLVSHKDFILRRTAPDTDTEEGPLPVEMKPGAYRALIQSFEKQMQTFSEPSSSGGKSAFRWLIHEQVRKFSLYLENPEVGYQPFRFPA